MYYSMLSDDYGLLVNLELWKKLAKLNRYVLFKISIFQAFLIHLLVLVKILVLYFLELF